MRTLAARPPLLSALIHTYMHVGIQPHICTNTHALVCTPTTADTYACIHAHTHTHKCTPVRMRRHAAEDKVPIEERELDCEVGTIQTPQGLQDAAPTIDWVLSRAEQAVRRCAAQAGRCAGHAAVLNLLHSDQGTESAATG